MSAPAIRPIVTAACEEVDAAATTRLGVDGGPLGVLDARGDGFTEDVGVGDTGTTVGLAVAVAVGFGRVCVGAGVGDECVGVGDGVDPTTVIVPCIVVGCTLQWYANVPAVLNVKEKLWPGFKSPESNECPSFDVAV